ncbi:MAG: LLM class flavin-dependent oxidoreductase [Acidimicrobiia bacterium]|nr:LLM class flavin-dependent oxidoreductase [Acidimicrobiia bacterium]
MAGSAASVVAAAIGSAAQPGAGDAQGRLPWEPGYKVRIGVAAGAGVIDDPAGYLRLVDALDDLGFDSIWVPDVVTGAVFDPVAALGVAAGRRARLKIGSHLILPGRDPVWLAKQLATLDQLSAGRLLLLAVIGLNQPDELDAQGVVASERTAMLEESLEVMRALWTGETVHREGAHGRRYEAVRLTVRPAQAPLEVWLGGQVPAALRRCGRVGDGWMPGLCTPEEAGAAVQRIQAEAVANGRMIDREHFGMNLSWVPDRITDEVRAGIEARRPGFDPGITVGVGPTGLAERIEAFIDAGISKFVIRPAVNPPSWAQAVEAVAPVLALQT